MNTYLISEEKLKYLIKRDIELGILEVAGVDNWNTPESIFNEYGKDFEIELPTTEVLEIELSFYEIYNSKY